MKLKTRKFKAFSTEAIALIDYLLQESVARQTGMGYRLKIPYNSIVHSDRINDGNMVVEIRITYDGEFKEVTNEQREAIKITGADKGRH